MRSIPVLVTLFAVTSGARADQLHFSSPGPYETTLHVAAMATIALDLSTTLDLKRFGDRPDTPWSGERNPLLGRHPSDARIVGYGLGVMALHTVAWYFAPEEIRVLLDSAVIMVEVPMTFANMSAGLRLRIPFL